MTTKKHLRWQTGLPDHSQCKQKLSFTIGNPKTRISFTTNSSLEYLPKHRHINRTPVDTDMPAVYTMDVMENHSRDEMQAYTFKRIVHVLPQIAITGKIQRINYI